MSKLSKQRYATLILRGDVRHGLGLVGLLLFVRLFELNLGPFERGVDGLAHIFLVRRGDDDRALDVQ